LVSKDRDMRINGSELRAIIREEMAKPGRTSAKRRTRVSRSASRNTNKHIKRPGLKRDKIKTESLRRSRVDVWLDREIAKESRLLESKKKGCGCGCNNCGDKKLRRR